VHGVTGPILKSTTEVTWGREKRRKKMGKKEKIGGKRKNGKKEKKGKMGERKKMGKKNLGNRKKIKKSTNSNFGFHIGYSVCQPKRTSGRTGRYTVTTSYRGGELNRMG
jgi:hypothetical protein